MLYRHITEHCFETRIGKDGVTQSHIDALLEELRPALEALQRRTNADAAPLLKLPAQTQDLADIEQFAASLKKRFKHIVVAGAGGSGLSGRVLAALRLGAQAPSLHFLEIIDPDAVGATLAQCPADDTGFIVISKSGTTAETLAHFYVLAEHARGCNIAEHFIVITAAGSNPLRTAAQELGARILEHAPDIGGRFSILTNVGLLPAALAGLDIGKLRQGAQTVVAGMDGAADAGHCPPALGAAIQYAFSEQGRNISIMLPYSERLSGFASWYRQSWAESLGKNGRGTTPMRAVGTTDQHSQLQLYLGGPKDKLFNLITLNRAGSGQRLSVPDKKELAYLRGKTTGDIMAAEQKATLETLVRNRCPVRLFELDALAEEQLGALLMHFTLEIIFMARLLKVNPFNQPAVEESKRLARDYLLTGNV